MILLVDSNALLWWLADDPKLDPLAARSIVDPVNTVIVSVGSVWEIEIKRSAGRLDAPADLLEQLAAASFEALPITAADALVAARLPLHHTDPFDRMIVAHALRLDATIVSRDRAFDAYGVNRLAA